MEFEGNNGRAGMGMGLADGREVESSRVRDGAVLTCDRELAFE